MQKIRLQEDPLATMARMKVGHGKGWASIRLPWLTVMKTLYAAVIYGR